MSDLAKKHCTPCTGDTPRVSADQVKEYLRTLSGWEANSELTEISKAYEFKNYYETMAFVNALAFIAHREDHHPDLEVGYNSCRVRYATHAIGGLSENDFICASKVEGLVAA